MHLTFKKLILQHLTYHFIIYLTSKLTCILLFYLNIISLLFFIIFFNLHFYLSLSLSLLNPTILLATTTGITKPKATTPNSQQPPHYQQPPCPKLKQYQQPLQTYHTNPTINHHSTTIATITRTHPQPLQIKTPTTQNQITNSPIQPTTITNHKPTLEITKPKSKRAYFFKFFTQNQITKPTQTQSYLSKPSHTRRTTVTLPPRSTAKSHEQTWQNGSEFFDPARPVLP